MTTIRVLRSSALLATIGVTSAALMFVPPHARATETTKLETISNGVATLRIEFLDDDLVHFELAAGLPEAVDSIPTSIQVSKTDYTGPAKYSRDGNVMATANLSVSVNDNTLCATVTDTTKTPALVLNTICPRNLDQAWKGLSITKESMTNVYGLGEHFPRGGNADGDWIGKIRTAGGPFGNAMVYDTDNGPVDNAQIPILYAAGAGNDSYALFADTNYKQEWNFTGDPWTFDTYGDQLRWYIMQGSDLRDLRSDYLELTGRSPVPPKKAFGLWASEFGWDNWAELDANLAGLRNDGFPTDGAMLDVNWFGNVTKGSENSRMGSLEWDTSNFPNPTEKIASLKAAGIGVIPIEEPYVAKGLPEHSDMAARGYLVRSGCSTCSPVYLTDNDWWGRGGMIDFTNKDASAYWHQNQRKPLVDQGVLGHWLDLGEPEMYDSNDWVKGMVAGKHAHADYHNYYDLAWTQGVAAGYRAQGSTQRPFMLTRSGAAGIQHTGAALWSGDIGSTLTALADQQNVQMHMSMSGIDYFGSDIGGFRREMATTDINELFTQWFANSSWFDIPVRPHTENLCNCTTTSPNKIGDKASNLANIQRRYELTPYYYSLAHRAWTHGEPLTPPLVMNYQSDPNVRTMGSEKMIGRDLLVGIVAGSGERQRNMYLPAGTWYDYISNTKITSNGEWINDVPLWRNGVFTLPVYARAGAIIPKMHVDDHTKTVDGMRADGVSHPELIVRVYPADTLSAFTLAEDDGASIDYQGGAVRTTELSQSTVGSQTIVTIDAASGTYANAVTNRPNVVELVSETQASAVTLNGSPLTQHPNKEAFDAADSGWYNAGNNLVVAKSADMDVNSTKTFAFTTGQPPVSAILTCTNGTTEYGQSVYVVGSVPQLGSWDPASAVKLDPTSYPTWSGVVSALPPNSEIKWKCIKRQENNYPSTVDAWQPGADNTFNTVNSGESPPQVGGF
ncbi:glycoside hydrolase family 31 protein [Trueperella pyogenes]|uniref:TIM-barrel domain-containing protein n=1 Tax=Trueperella pyogenes TaxID=1661 RepID=UPI003132BEDF